MDSDLIDLIVQLLLSRQRLAVVTVTQIQKPVAELHHELYIVHHAE